MPPLPSEAKPGEFMPTGYETGYHTAMDYRFVSGDFVEHGPAVAWMRMRVPLVAGEEPSPLTRVLAAADSGNGVSSTLDWHHWLFVNVDLTVHLNRMPRGEWVCLDAITVPECDRRRARRQRCSTTSMGRSGGPTRPAPGATARGVVTT